MNQGDDTNLLIDENNNFYELYFNNNNINLSFKIKDNSELIIVIKPILSLFNIYDKKSKLLIKNYDKF